MKRVLFVCSGNTCRSPMAELYFSHLCRRSKASDLAAESAGLCAWSGTTASPCALEVLQNLGIDGTDFRSRRFSGFLAQECDVIVGMTRGHARAIAELCPEAADRTRTLLPGDDVPDPYGGTVECYQEIFDLMRPALDGLFSELSGK